MLKEENNKKRFNLHKLTKDAWQIRIGFSIFVRTNFSIMDTKLTLKLDKKVIERAKKYAVSKNRSLSRIIESYLQTLTIQDDSKNNKADLDISPFVKSMSTGVHIPVELDYKKEYSDYLTQKYR